MASARATARDFVRQRPDPERLWAALAPKRWPTAGGLTVDLSPAGRARPGRWEEADAGNDPPASLAEVDDVLWLPPVASEHRPLRDLWVAEAASAGVPVLAQLAPGETIDAIAAETGTGLVRAVDLFEALTGGNPDALGSAANADLAVWPLLPGWTDRPEVVEPGLAALREAGHSTVVGVRVELHPRELRELVDRVPEAWYASLFHAPPSDRQSFARAVCAEGLEPFIERPLPVLPEGLRRRRWLAGRLMRIGELWIGLERSEITGQAFFRAARWVDESSLNVGALATEGNLGIVDWIVDPVRGVIEELSGTGESVLLDQLEREFHASAP